MKKLIVSVLFFGSFGWVFAGQMSYSVDSLPNVEDKGGDAICGTTQQQIPVFEGGCETHSSGTNEDKALRDFIDRYPGRDFLRTRDGMVVGSCNDSKKTIKIGDKEVEVYNKTKCENIKQCVKKRTTGFTGLLYAQVSGLWMNWAGNIFHFTNLANQNISSRKESAGICDQSIPEPKAVSACEYHPNRGRIVGYRIVSVPRACTDSCSDKQIQIQQEADRMVATITEQRLMACRFSMQKIEDVEKCIDAVMKDKYAIRQDAIRYVNMKGMSICTPPCKWEVRSDGGPGQPNEQVAPGRCISATQMCKKPAQCESVGMQFCSKGIVTGSECGMCVPKGTYCPANARL
jgi:hypothetical protein